MLKTKRINIVPYFEGDALQMMRCDYFKGRSDMQLHFHNYYTVSLLLYGTLLERDLQETTSARQCSVLIKPPGELHSNTFTEDCSILSLLIYDWDYYKMPFREINIADGPAAYTYFLNVLQAKDKRQAIGDLNTFLKLQIKEAALLNIPEWLTDVKAIIDQHFLEPLQISTIAKAVGKHPIHVSRTYKKYYGVDIKTYQQQLRLHQAVSGIAQQKHNLTSLSYECGFYDQSHFSRSFKKATKLSPRKAAKLFSEDDKMKNIYGGQTIRWDV